MILLYITAGMLFLTFITRPFIVLLHEMGHAVPALIMTSQPVTVYIGSYGDPRRSKQFRLGRLTIWFKISLFWKTGLCVIPQQDMSRWQRALFVLGGPIASITIATIGCYFIFNYDLHGLLKAFFIAFTFFAAADLLLNLIPNSTTIYLHNGKVAYNDGQALKMLWYYRKFSEEYEKAIIYFDNQQYQQAAILLERFIAYKLRSPDIYERAITSRINLQEHEAALTLYRSYAANCTLSSEGYGLGGWLA